MKRGAPQGADAQPSELPDLSGAAVLPDLGIGKSSEQRWRAVSALRDMHRRDAEILSQLEVDIVLRAGLAASREPEASGSQGDVRESVCDHDEPTRRRRRGASLVGRSLLRTRALRALSVRIEEVFESVTASRFPRCQHINERRSGDETTLILAWRSRVADFSPPAKEPACSMSVEDSVGEAHSRM